MPWPPGDGLAATAEGEAAGGENLSRYAVLALGVSGRPEAAEHPRTLEADADLPQAFRTEIGDVVEQSLELNAEVGRLGVVEYDGGGMP